MGYKKLKPKEWCKSWYKYILINEITKKDKICHAFENLSNNTLYFQNPSKFNDPFDSNVHIYPCSYEEYLIGLRKAIDEEWPEKTLYEKSIEFTFQKINTTIERTLENYVKLKKDDMNKCGVLCLTDNNTNILMWSHYTDGHKGICVEIDLETCYKTINEMGYSDRCIVGKVDYSDYFPHKNFIRAYLSEDPYAALEEIQDILYTKSTKWSYENEVRVVIQMIADRFRLIKFPDGIFKSITLGCNIRKEHKQEIENIVSNLNYNLPIIEIETSKTEYKFVIKS